MTRPHLPRLTGLLDAAAREGVAPALAVEVRRGGSVLHQSHHGQAQLLPAPRPLGPGDLFDVASLTKVMATASIAALLVDAGALELDAPVARLLPEVSPTHRGITLRHLLAHTSGLPAWRPLHAAGRGSDAVVAVAAATPLEAAPGTRAVYSDLGFILLGAALERAAGAPLDALFAARVSVPLGLAATFFLRQGDPVGAARRAQHRFAATRRTPERGVLV
ncbi:MAG TPA: serine hydrolase domain-containing protein, partial [Anaeromyxobacteraceae bacterium]